MTAIPLAESLDSLRETIRWTTLSPTHMRAGLLWAPLPGLELRVNYSLTRNPGEELANSTSWVSFVLTTGSFIHRVSPSPMLPAKNSRIPTTLSSCFIHPGGVRAGTLRSL